MCIYIYMCEYIYIYIYMLAPPPHDPHIWPREGGFGRGGGLQTPDFQKKSGVPGPRTPDSRFPEKIWSTPRLQTPDFRTPRLQTPDFQKKSGVPPDSRLQISKKNLEYRDSGLQILESVIWSLGPRVLQIFSGNLESGVRGPGTPDFFWKSGVWSPGPLYSRFFLEIWSLESGAPVLQIFSGNLESGVRGPGTPDFFWKSGVWSPGRGYSRFFWKSGVWSPGRGYSRFFLEIWSLESGAWVLQIFSGNLESGVRGPGTPDFFWKSGVWSPVPGYSRFFLEI